MTRPEAEAAVDLELQQTGLTRREWYRTIYLKSDHWKNLRTMALQHHGKKCHKCPATKKLDVHHLRYSSIYDIEVTDLQVLCRKCHDKEHETVCTPNVRKARKPARKKAKKKEKRTPMTPKQWKKARRKEKIARKAAQIAEQRKKGCAPSKPAVVTIHGVRLFRP